MRIAVYSKTGTQLAIVESLELHDEWMAECYVTVTVKSPLPIDFGVGDYIDYRGERFTIQYDPTALKKARRGTYGEGFTYESIKFVGVQDEIVRCDFNDIVLNDNGIHYTALPTFPFFCSNVDDLLDRIQANLEELYPGQWMVICLDPVRTAERGELVDRRAEFVAAYNQYIGEGTEFTYEKTNVAETVDNINCWEALRKVHDDFALNFIIRGRVVVVGGTGYYSAINFKYGKGHGLYELEKIGDSSQQITTRLRAYGNTTNLPSRYYANLNMRIYGTALDGGSNSTDIDVIFRKDYFLNPWNGSETNIVVQIGETVYPNTVAYKNAVDETIIINTRTSDPITQGTKIYILSGVDEDKWPVSNREYGSENLPDNMAVSRLMLPGFPLQSLAAWVEDHYELEGYEWLADAVAKGYTFSTSKYRPYIDSPNINKYGIRPSSIYFDGSNDNEDIHPTLEGTGVDVVVAADQIQDNGIYDTGDVPNFKITLPDLGFVLGEYWQKHTTGSIDMKDGMCGSRSFEIAKRPKQNENHQWVCEVKRTHDDVLDLWFPYKDFNIQAGDHYTLSEIDMPDYYVEKNAEKLLKAAIEALSKNDYPRLTYQPRIDAEFMQRQDDTAKASGGAVQSLHDTLKAGDLFSFEDTDLDIDASIVIDVLTIKEYGENGIPSYEITLRDDKSVSPIEKISSKVESIISGETPVGGYTTKQIGSLIETYGEDIFLSKIYDDVAQGNMNFQQNLSVGNDLDVGGNAHIIGQTRIDGLLRALANIITNGIESEHYEGGWDNPFGSGFQINERSTDHVSFLSVDNLFVRMKAVFTELEIRKISYAGGNIIFSHAGSRIVSVTPIYDTYDLSSDGTTAVLDGSAQFAGTELHINAGGAFDGTTKKSNDASQVLVGYRCYLMKDDGTTATENWWRVDDQARCQTFNIDESGTYHNVSNSFYWRRVMAVGTELLEDGLNYDYVDLSVTDAIEGSTVPQAGDTIVQMGNRTDTDRQGFISIQVAGEYAPSFEVYKGVNSYSLSGKRKICISPKYTEIRANKIIETTETGDYPLPHFRTEPWYTGMHCYYYDVVQHNGSSWLCIYPEGGTGGVPYTTEEPSENATYWRIFASEGKTGGETLTVYAWGTSDETAPAISGNAYPPAGWSTRITDRPSGGDYYLWMAETKKDADGVIAEWGIPACISGADGTPGEDAKNTEYIYKYDISGYNGNIGEVSPSGAASGSDTNKQQDDWVPNGWYDRALAVSESNPDVYMSSRKYNASTETWGAFGAPVLWGHYGQKGIDGDGVQYVYKLFDHELTDAERTSNIPTKPAQPNPQGEWIPTGWSDDPQAPTSSMPFCYCSVIKEINGTWGLFEKLGLWSKWAEDGKSITKKSETYRYATNNTGIRPAADSQDWSTTKPTLNKGYWLYTETTITWSDDSTTILYTDERNPNDGVAGQDIIVDRNEVTYALTQTNQQPAESAFGPYPSTLTQGWWLWSKSTTYYKKATTSEAAGSSSNYSVSYIAEDGAPGRGITSVIEYYKASANSSGEVAPAGDVGWETDPNVAMQSWNETNKYLWNYEKITYSSGNPSRSTPSVIAIWTEDGAPGQGIDSITNYYKVSTKSGVGGDVETYPTTAAEWAQWDDDPVAPTADNPFLWNFEVISWVNPTTTTHTNPQMIGHYGRDGENAANCIVDRQAVFVPTDADGKVLEDFELIVPFRVIVGNEQVGITNATLSEESTSRYATICGGFIKDVTNSKITVSGTKAIMDDSEFDGTTLVMGDTYVAGPNGVKFKVGKNAVLNEHMVYLTVTGVDGSGNEYVTYASIEILSNTYAKDGDTPISVYAWNQSPTSAPSISGNVYPPSGWSTTALARPEGDDWYLWMSSSVKRGDGTILDWSTPVRISGNDGSAGEDAKEREWVYKLSDSNPGTPANPSDRTIDDYIPAGWNDNPSGVDVDHKTEWTSWRDFDHETQLWGDFHSPVVWSHYGRNGMDGDGVEYVFIRTNSDVAPTIVNSPDSRQDSRGHTYVDDEYLPLASGGTLSTDTECTDDPQGVTQLLQYEWVAKRTKGAADASTGVRVWEKYSGTMSLWAKYSENAIHMDLDNEMDVVVTNSTGKLTTARTITTIATIYDGASVATAATLVSTAASIAIGGVTPTLSISNGVITATWLFTTANTIAAAATVNIIAQYQGLNYQVKFTVAPSMGGAIFQLKPSKTSLSFQRNSDNTLTPASYAVGLEIVKLDGASTATYSTAASAGVIVRYSTNAMPSSASGGNSWTSGDITVSNTATALYIAMFNSAGTLLDRETIPCIKDGSNGAAGGNTATVMLYKRSASSVTSVGISTTLYYKFSTKKLYTNSACTTEATTQLNGWSLTIPNNSTEQIYVTAAIAFSNTESDDIARNEWVTPAQFTENGEPGAHGVNTATIMLYKRSATAISAHGITTTLYYKFADGKLYTKSGSTYTEATDANLKNWKREIPAVDGNPCYVIQVAALGAEDYDEIATSDWSSVRKLVEDGADGMDNAIALLTPQVLSIPVNTSGQVLEDFRQVVPISLTTNSEELRLSEVTILSGGTNVEFGPAILKSLANSKTTFSGTKAVMPDAQFSGTTLVVGSGSVLVPGSLIVKGAKNATITEHVCEIRVKGYDSQMKEYTAKTSLSIIRNVQGADGADGADGTDGDDAVNVSLTPQSVILTQNEAGQMPTLTDAYTMTNVKLGTVDVTSLSTILSATPSKYTVSGATYNTCTCSISGNRVTITAIDQHGTETIEGQTINKYCEQGYIDIVVRYNGVNTTVRFNFYCNLLGTWKREVEGDTEHIIATKTFNVLDKNGNVVAHQTMGDYIRSSSQNTAKLTDATTDSSGNYIKSSELKQTADGLSSDVSAIKMGKNLFKGALSADGWASEGSVPYTTPSGTGRIPPPPDVGDDGWFNVADSSHNYICRSSVSLKKNQWYVLSFYTKTTTAFNVTIYKTAASAGSWTTVKTLAIPAGSASTRRYVAFEMPGATSDNNFFSFPVKTLRYPQLELGKDGTSTPTAFDVDSVTETSSRISQTADHIEAKVGDCGIDIDNKTITLTAEKTTISGELTVPRVMNENAEMVTTCEAGVVKVQSKSTASYGVFAINSLGEVVLQMYDKDGGLVLNLGGTPNTAVNGEWVAVKFKRVDSRGFIADTRENFTATDVNCNTYYRLKLGAVMNSGSPIQYYLPNGNQTTNSTVIGRNNRVFISNYSTESAIATGTFIADGYYVEKNDGIFMQEMSEYFPDEVKYSVNVYHYENGKITELTKHYF